MKSPYSIRIYLQFFIFSLVINACSPPPPAPIAEENPQQEQIAGTPIYYTLHPDIKTKDYFPQLTLNDDIQIGFVYQPTSFYEVKNLHGRSVYESKDYGLLEYKEGKIRQYESLQINYNHIENGYYSYIALIGNAQHFVAATINSYTPLTKKEVARYDVLLQNITFRFEEEYDPMQLLDYTIRYKSKDWKIDELIVPQQIMLYNADHDPKSDGGPQSSITITKHLGNYPFTEDFLKECFNRKMVEGYMNYPDVHLKIGYLKMDFFEFIEGFKTVQNNLTGERALCYGAIVRGSEQHHYYVHALAFGNTPNFDVDLKKIRETIMSIKLKE